LDAASRLSIEAGWDFAWIGAPRIIWVDFGERGARASPIFSSRRRGNVVDLRDGVGPQGLSSSIALFALQPNFGIALAGLEDCLSRETDAAL
jgi:hypothetical protein